MSDWLHKKAHRIPKISDEQIAKMRHIEPLVKVPNSVMYRKQLGIEKVHPKNQTFYFEVEPTGPEFTFEQLNTTTIITQHLCSYFFKPCLAEIYAWMLFYLRDDWSKFTNFHITKFERIGSSVDCVCWCTIMGGPKLVHGDEVKFANGEIGHELIPEKS